MTRKHLRLHHVGWLPILVLLQVVVTVAPAKAQIIDWIGGGGGAYDSLINWSPANVPNTIAETARFNIAGTFNVTLSSGTTRNINDLLVNSGDVTFASNGVILARLATNDDALIDGGNLTLSRAGGAGDVTLIVGDRLSVSGGSTFTLLQGSDVTAANLGLGLVTGNGTLIVDGAGSTLTVSTSTDLGQNGSIGTLTFQNNSTGNTVNGTVDLMAGSGAGGSTGRLNVFSGSTLSTGSIDVGRSGSASAAQEGTLRVDGFDSKLTMTGASTLTIGDDVNPNVVSDVIISGSGVMSSGTGAILIRNSGHLNVASGTFNANGNVTIDGATLTESASGSADFALGNGLSLTARNSAQLNFNKDYTISLNTTWTLQSGADYNTNSGGDDLLVGNFSDGTLVVENSGSSLDIGNGTGGFTQIGENGATGTVTIRDSATAFLGLLNVADDNDAGTTGILNIEDGAQVTTRSVDVARTAGITTNGTINIGGTTGTARLTVSGVNTLDVGNSSGNGSGTINITNFRGELISGTGRSTIHDSGLIEINDGLFRANGNVLVGGGELRETNNGTFDLEPGLTLTANDAGQVNFSTAYDIDEDTTFLIQGGADFSVTSFLDIGNGLGDSSTLTVEGAGSTVTVTSTMAVGKLGATGSLTLRDQASGSFGAVAIGEFSTTLSSTGTVLVQSGADVTSGNVLVSDEGGVGSAGSLTITGAGSAWAAAALVLGHASSGTAEVKVLNGGTLTTSLTATFEDTGVMTLDGGTVDLAFHTLSGGRIDFISGSLTSGNDWTIEGGGILGNLVDLTPGKHLATSGGGDDVLLETSGTLILNGGSLDVDGIVDNGGTFQFNSGTLAMRGFNAFTVDSTSVFGSAFTLGANQHVVLNSQAVVAAGALLTLSGGTINSTSALLNNGTTTVGAGSLLDVASISNQAGAQLLVNGGALVRVDGTISSTNFGEIILGGNGATFRNDSTQPLSNSGLIRGDGTVTGLVNHTGELRTGIGQRLFLPDGFNGSNGGLISLQGGTFEAGVAMTNNSAGNILGRGTLRTGGTGLVNQGDLALSNGVTDIFGDVANQTTGRVIISGNADVTFWDDVTDSGTLFHVHTGSSATFFGTAGFGIDGGGDVFLEADVTPGASPGLENFGGNVHFGVLANLQIEIMGTIPGAEFDVLNVLGDVTLGGTLDVSLLNLFSLSPGLSFEILDVGGSLSGTFSGLVEGGLVGNFGGTNLLITYAGGDGNDVSLFSALPGDFDLDNDVDGADFLNWQRGFGTIYNGNDLADWETNYGTIASPITAASSAVPEPTTAIMLMLGMTAMLLRRQFVTS